MLQPGRQVRGLTGSLAEPEGSSVMQFLPQQWHLSSASFFISLELMVEAFCNQLRSFHCPFRKSTTVMSKVRSPHVVFHALL